MKMVCMIFLVTNKFVKFEIKFVNTHLLAVVIIVTANIITISIIGDNFLNKLCQPVNKSIPYRSMLN